MPTGGERDATDGMRKDLLNCATFKAGFLGEAKLKFYKTQTGELKIDRVTAKRPHSAGFS